ncbi:MAG: pirin family protein [Stellaceae bacterium]
MITVRSAEERGLARLGWLTSRHSFSFGDYRDPRHMGFGPLRVINEDRVEPGAGFDTHGHRDMEIVSYVLEGALEHKDNIGTGSVIRPGEVQRMTAGTGIRHSEFNPSQTEPVHFLQIWLLPTQEGLKPGYEQKSFPSGGKRNTLRLVVSPDGAEGSVLIHQDARIYDASLDEGARVTHRLGKGRRAWLQVVRGSLDLEGEWLRTGDGAAIEAAESVTIAAHDPQTEILLFDLL